MVFFGFSLEPPRLVPNPKEDQPDRFCNQHSPFNHDVINRVAEGSRNLLD